MGMRKSRLSGYKQRHLIGHFIAGTTARTAASLCGVNRKTAAFYFHRLREIIAYELEQEADTVFCGEVEVDESYFGGRRKGKRGRSAGGKVPVFGLLKRGGKVYTKIISDASSASLCPIIERKVVPDSIVYTDTWRVMKWSCFLGQFRGSAKMYRISVHAAFRVSVWLKYVLSGVRLSSTV